MSRYPGHYEGGGCCWGGSPDVVLHRGGEEGDDEKGSVTNRQIGRMTIVTIHNTVGRIMPFQYCEFDTRI